MESRGLGDDIKKITAATGLDKLTKRIAQILDEDCGCDKRQERLNKYPSVLNKLKGKK
jgi:hypothetical protein